MSEAVVKDGFWWQREYKPQPNHLDDTQSYLYETFGKDLQYIREMAQTTKRVWTLVEGDEGELCWVAGMHHINRLNYAVTEVPWETGDECILDD